MALIDRRVALTGSLSLLAPAAAAGAGRDLKGLRLPSDSVQLACYSDDASRGFSMRLGRYPTENVAWVWAHVWADGRVWSYTDDRLALSPRTRIADERAVYRQTEGADLTFDRLGPKARPRSVRLSAQLMSHAVVRAEHGRGAVPIRLEAEFEPAAATAGFIPDRAEAKGRVRAVLRVGRQTIRISGEGGFHEQAQTEPRFTTPFVYLRGSGPEISFTFVRAAAASGFLFRNGGEAKLTAFEIARPDRPTRPFRVALEPGGSQSGTLEVVQTYWVRVFDDWRRSQIIRGRLGEHRFVGGVNDWLEAKIAYGPP